MSEPSVFISYSREDKEIARGLAAALIEAEMKVWIDEGELLIGDSLIERIASGIQEADFLVALVSPNSIGSNWCRKEISLAISGGIGGGTVKVLPVRVGSVAMPPTLADVFYLDFDESDADQSPGVLITNIQRHFLSSVLSIGNEILPEVSPIHANPVSRIAVSADAISNPAEVAALLESGLLSKMDRTQEAALILSLVPSNSGRLLIDSQKLAELRLDLSNRRVIPPSPYVDWLHIGVGSRRFLLDGGIGDGGMKFCAAELLTDGSGVFAFMIHPSSGSVDGGTFIFNDEVVVAAVLGGLWLLGEHASKRAVAGDPYYIRASLVCPEDHQNLQPGLSRNYLTGNIWRGTRALELAVGLEERVERDSIFEPSAKFVAVAHRLTNELFQSFGMSECPQLDGIGRIRIKYWGAEWSGELAAWANKHGIEISDETIAN